MLPRRRFEPGTVVAGRYRIVSSLGRGGMGEVYRADDFKLVETVALKFLPESVERDPKRLESLLEEARLARRVSHPNICRVHDIGETEDGSHFISMEYVDGENLASLLRRIGRLPQSKALEIAREILQALKAAHDAGILHRDLKPANLMLDGSGRVRVTDFGLASAIGSAAGGGTLAYMAPELFHGQRGSVQSDLYALGLVFYELFTGQRLFRARSRDELKRLHRSTEPTPPSQVVRDIAPELDDLILRCLRKDPARRPASVAALEQTLTRLQERLDSDSQQPEEEPTDKLSTTEVSASSMWGTQSKSRLLPIGLVLLAGALLSSLFWLWQARDTTMATDMDSALESATPIRVRPGMALLPIQDLTRDPEGSWIGLALAEVLFSELAIDGSHRLIPQHQVDEALIELDLEAASTVSSEDLQRLRVRLGVERVLFGSFSRISQEVDGLLRFDVRLVDTEDGGLVASSGATGTDSQFFDLASRVGNSLRRELESSELSPEENLALRRALPEDPNAARLYLQGLDSLRRLDLNAARRLLLEAVEVSPRHPAPLAALSEVWWKLGFEKRAQEAVAKAVTLSDSMDRRSRQEIEARAAKFDHRLDDAIPLLEALVRAYPDELEHHVALVEVLIEAGVYAEAEVALAKARGLPAPLGEHPILDHLEARIHQRQGNFQEQQRLAGRAAEKGERIGAMTLVAAARLREASAHQRLGDPKAAAVAIEQSRSLYQGLGNTAGVARSLQHLGQSLYRRGDLAEAERLLLRALGLFGEIGHDLNRAGIQVNLANIDYLRGNSSASMERLEEASTIYRQLENDAYLGLTLNNLGGLQLVQGRLESALGSFREALDSFGRIENRGQSAAVLNNLGEVLFYRGDLEQSRRTLQEARALATEVGDRVTESYSLYRQAENSRVQGDDFVARAHYESALEILEDTKDQVTAAEVRLGLARLALQEGNVEQAETHAGRAEQTFRSVDARELRNLAQSVLIACLLARGQTDEAARELATLTEAVDSESWPRVRYEVSLLEARLRSSDRPDEALAILGGLAAETRDSLHLGYELEAQVLALEIAQQSGRALESPDSEVLLGRVEEHGFGALARRLRRHIDPDA